MAGIYTMRDTIEIDLDEWEESGLSEGWAQCENRTDASALSNPLVPSVVRTDLSPPGELEASYEILKPAQSWGEFYSSTSETSDDSEYTDTDSSVTDSEEEENKSVCSNPKYADEEAKTKESPAEDTIMAESDPLAPHDESTEMAVSTAQTSASSSVIYTENEKPAMFDFEVRFQPVTLAGAITKSSNDVVEPPKFSPAQLESDVYSRKTFDDQHLFTQNMFMQTKIELLENLIRDKKEGETASPGSLRSATLQRNIDDYTKKIDEMIDCSFDIEHRFDQERTIIKSCADMMIDALKSKTFNDAESLTEYERALRNYRKNLINVQLEILGEKQKMFSAQKHYQKILSDYRHLVLELNAVELENAKAASIDKDMQKHYTEIEQSQDERNEELNKRKAELDQQQKEMASIDKVQQQLQQKYAEIEKHQDERDEELKKREAELARQQKEMASIDKKQQQTYAEIEKSLVERDIELSKREAELAQQRQQMQTSNERTLLQTQIEKLATMIDALEEEKEKLTAERKSIEDAKKTEDSQKQMQEFENRKTKDQIKVMRDEILLLRKKCCEFTDTIDALKAENNSMRLDKNGLLQERDFLNDTKKMLEVEMASLEDKHKELQKKYVSLQNDFCTCQEDLNNFKDELAGSHEIIKQLQSQNSEFQVNANAVEAYKIQMEEREKDLLDMFQAENNYLHQIEKLSNENREVREEIERLRNQERLERLRNQAPPQPSIQ